MGYPLRSLVPDTLYFVTFNCSERRFFLRPDRETTEWIAYWLARASRRHPMIVLYGVVAMSNHLHLLVRDRGSALSSFMGYFMGNLAKTLNGQRQRQGRVFERRFASEPVLDEAAQMDRLAYLVNNPVKAALVERFEDWPGLLLWSQDGMSVDRPVRAFDRVGYERAVASVKHGAARPERKNFEFEETLYVSPAEPMEDQDVSLQEYAASVLEVVRAREAEHARDRRANGQRVMGGRQAQTQDWRRAPSRVKRSPRPICHAGSELRRRQYADGWRALRAAFVEASVAFRAGEFEVEFPAYTCRPSGGYYEPAQRWMAAA